MPAAPGDWRCCGSRVAASRWTDLRTELRELRAEIKADYHTIGLNLRSTDLSLTVSGRTIHDGRVARGMLQVSGPAQPVEAVFRAPCDVLHLHVSNAFLADCYQEAQGHAYPGDIVLADPRFARDAAIEQLGYALLGAEATAGSFGQLYADGLALAIVTRLLGMYSNCGGPASPPKIAGLPKWRLNRVVDYVEAHLAESITLADLAATTGLTRMHFAAQFRAATGLRPHEYVLRKRIEHAQDLILGRSVSLVEIALTVGFQTQAHFTTVFKRFIGETPYQWRQLNAWTRRGSARPLCGPQPEAFRLHWAQQPSVDAREL
jgi:AraC-like DNA-binding protein